MVSKAYAAAAAPESSGYSSINIISKRHSKLSVIRSLKKENSHSQLRRLTPLT